jgi:hypothetical protein
VPPDAPGLLDPDDPQLAGALGLELQQLFVVGADRDVLRAAVEELAAEPTSSEAHLYARELLRRLPPPDAADDTDADADAASDDEFAMLDIDGEPVALPLEPVACRRMLAERYCLGGWDAVAQLHAALALWARQRVAAARPAAGATADPLVAAPRAVDVCESAVDALTRQLLDALALLEGAANTLVASGLQALRAVALQQLARYGIVVQSHPLPTQPVLYADVHKFGPGSSRLAVGRELWEVLKRIRVAQLAIDAATRRLRELERELRQAQAPPPRRDDGATPMQPDSVRDLAAVQQDLAAVRAELERAELDLANAVAERPSGASFAATDAAPRHPLALAVFARLDGRIPKAQVGDDATLAFRWLARAVDAECRSHVDLADRSMPTSIVRELHDAWRQAIGAATNGPSGGVELAVRDRLFDPHAAAAKLARERRSALGNPTATGRVLDWLSRAVDAQESQADPQLPAPAAREAARLLEEFPVRFAVVAYQARAAALEAAGRESAGPPGLEDALQLGSGALSAAGTVLLAASWLAGAAVPPVLIVRLFLAAAVASASGHLFAAAGASEEQLAAQAAAQEAALGLHAPGTPWMRYAAVGAALAGRPEARSALAEVVRAGIDLLDAVDVVRPLGTAYGTLQVAWFAATLLDESDD